MASLAKGTNPDVDYWSNIRIEHNFDEFKKIDSNSNAKFMALCYYMWSKGKFKNIENNAIVSIKNNIEVHHVFPSNYLKTTFGDNSPEYDLADSVLNKILINKISNIKISNKAPGNYLTEIKNNVPNNKIEESLLSHFIGETNDLVNGLFDRDYLTFILNRYKKLKPLFNELKHASTNLSNGKTTNIWM
jgi:hypothetical protein